MPPIASLQNSMFESQALPPVATKPPLFTSNPANSTTAPTNLTTNDAANSASNPTAGTSFAAMLQQNKQKRASPNTSPEQKVPSLPKAPKASAFSSQLPTQVKAATSRPTAPAVPPIVTVLTGDEPRGYQSNVSAQPIAPTGWVSRKRARVDDTTAVAADAVVLNAFDAGASKSFKSNSNALQSAYVVQTVPYTKPVFASDGGDDVNYSDMVREDLFLGDNVAKPTRRR